MVEREQGRGQTSDEAVTVEGAPREQSPPMSVDAETANADTEFERAMEIGRGVMTGHRAVLAALAK